MSTMLPIVFPPELLELFIDNIPQDSETGRKTLCTCLLVSRVFFRRSRSRLFAHVTIPSNNEAKLASLRDLLEYDAGDKEYPKLNLCIKSLKALIVLNDRDDMGDGTEFAATLSLLGTTGILRRFHLETVYNMNFSEIQSAEETFRAIQTICHSPSLEELLIENFNGVPAGLFNVWKLKKVGLDKSYLKLEADNVGSVFPKAQPCLRTFEYTSRLRGNSIPDTWLQKPSPFSGLRKLKAKLFQRAPDPKFDALLNILLDLASQTLQSLDIRAAHLEHTFHHHSPYSPSLRNLSALCQLQLSVFGNTESWDDRDYSFYDGTSNAVQMLQTIERAPPTLSRVTILLYPVILGGMTAFRNESDWQNLGNILVDGRFNSVEKVEPVLIDAPGQEGRPLFLEDFSPLWASKYPGIPFTVRRAQDYI